MEINHTEFFHDAYLPLTNFSNRDKLSLLVEVRCLIAVGSPLTAGDQLKDNRYHSDIRHNQIVYAISFSTGLHKQHKNKLTKNSSRL